MNGRCRSCADEKLRVSGVARVAEYGGVLGSIIRQYKFRGRVRFESVLAEWLTEAVSAASWRAELECVVSVPTHWRHRLGRPLYAADALADRVAGALRLPRLRLLRRVRAGPHQLGLSRTERAANVRGAFAIGRGVTMDGTRLLLVDDVRTTGATLNECAKVLLAAGAAKVFAAVVVTAGRDAPPRDLPLI